MPTQAGLKMWSRISLFLASVGVMIGVTAFMDGSWGNMVGRSLASFATAGVLAAFLGSQAGWLRHPTLLYLGKISYGLYVIHVLGGLCATHLLRETTARLWTLAGQLEIAFLALVITIAGAAVSYRWFESPFLRLKERFTYVPSRPV
jgi:peptidoglycan/LPS O-acetylase OafA/YrhL